MTLGIVPADDGTWVSEEFERLARVIQDYDPHLELRWIPPDQRTSEDTKPFCVFDTIGNYVVFHADEKDTPTDILAKLFHADNGKGNVLDRLEAANTAQLILNKKKQLDDWEEMNDKAEFMKTTPLHYIKVDGVKYNDHRRRI